MGLNRYQLTFESYGNIRFTGETSKMSWVALPVEPAYMGRRSGKTRRSPCSLAWLSNKITYKYVRKYEY